jgi:hypothetical protein
VAFRTFLIAKFLPIFCFLLWAQVTDYCRASHSLGLVLSYFLNIINQITMSYISIENNFRITSVQELIMLLEMRYLG